MYRKPGDKAQENDLVSRTASDAKRAPKTVDRKSWLDLVTSPKVKVEDEIFKLIILRLSQV